METPLQARFEATGMAKVVGGARIEPQQRTDAVFASIVAACASQLRNYAPLAVEGDSRGDHAT